MKIEGPSKTQQASKKAKSGKSGKSDGTFGAMVADAAAETSQNAATQSIAKVDSLLAVQGLETTTERGARRRMHVRADKILRQLDHLRLALLTGNLTLGQVVDVADVVVSHRENITDAKMTAVLDEIDLRAQIEIAKMRKAMESGQ
jgi:hypothetical protein